jgi:hypothetical protein
VPQVEKWKPRAVSYSTIFSDRDPKLSSVEDKFAVKNGDGPQLARALIKTHAHRDVGDGPKGDWLYLMFRSDGHLLLSERLEALGWTGEEEISKEEMGRFHDHWGTDQLA